MQIILNYIGIALLVAFLAVIALVAAIQASYNSRNRNDR